MAFNPRKHLTEEQINEIIDPISLAVGGAGAALVGYGLHRWSSARQRKAAEAEAEKRAGEAYKTGAGRGEAAGRAEGMRSGIDAGRELLAREQYLEGAHQRAGTRYSIAQHFGDPEIIKDAADHYRKLQTGWQTVLSQSDDANKGYVNAPHTFHMAVDKIKLHKDQTMSDDHARSIAALSGGRIEDFNHKGHYKIIQLIRSTAKNEGQRGLDKLTRTLVHHKHHDDETAMGMARILIHHAAHRIDEHYPQYPNGGHQFHSEQGPVWYHRDLPHPTNSTINAEVLRHKILRDLFAGTYKPDERVLDISTSPGIYVDHKKYGRILDINSLSRDRRAFEVDKAARGEGKDLNEPVYSNSARNIAAGEPVRDSFRYASQHGRAWAEVVHGQPAGSNVAREFHAFLVKLAEQRNREQKELAKQTPPEPPAPIAPIAPPAAPVAPPADQPETGKGRRGRPRKPKAEGSKPKGRPKKSKKVLEAMDFYSQVIDKQMNLQKKVVKF